MFKLLGVRTKLVVMMLIVMIPIIFLININISEYLYNRIENKIESNYHLAQYYHYNFNLSFSSLTFFL